MEPSGFSRLVERLVSHPTFQVTLNTVLTQSNPGSKSSMTSNSTCTSTTTSADTLSSASRPIHVRPDAQTLGPGPTATSSRSNISDQAPAEGRQFVQQTIPSTLRSPRFQSPAQEFPHIYGRGGSLNQARNFQQFVRGRDTRRYTPNLTRPRDRSRSHSRTASRPFIKEVVLLSRKDAAEVVKSRRKARLMECGLVQQEVSFSKEWTASQVRETLT